MLDPTFGTGGKVATELTFDAPTDDMARSLVIQQSDGKIVVVGESTKLTPPGKKKLSGGNSFSLARYDTDGSLDGTFGDQGRVTTRFSELGASVPTSVALQNDSKVIVAGYHFNEFGLHDLALARYNPDGSLDLDFGTGGVVFTDFGGNSQEGATDVTVLSDGKILVAGTSWQADTSSDIILARYTSSGALDTSFGPNDDGKVLADFAGLQNTASNMAIQNDGSIVLVGSIYADPATSYDFLVTRFTSDGVLDLGFGTGGMVATDFGNSHDGANAVSIDSSGRIIAGGHSIQAGSSSDYALARYTGTGALDQGFSGDGKVLTDFGISEDAAAAVAVRSDGAILAAGYSYFGDAKSQSDFSLACYNDDGSLNANFGQGGVALTDFGESDDYASGMALQSDGKIVLAGESYQGAGTGWDFALARYSSAGISDTNFGGGDGLVTTTFSIPTVIPARGNSLTIQQADGKILVVGQVDISGGNFVIARYEASGSLDTSFGAGGIVLSKFREGASDYATSVALQADGRIIVAGQSKPFLVKGIDPDFALARYNSDGTLDASFGNGGAVLTDFGMNGLKSDDGAFGVAIQSDGKVVVAGFSSSGTSGGYDFALARYTTEGMLDSDFGVGGKVLADIDGGTDFGYGVAIQGDGKIVVAGESYDPLTGYSDVAVARFAAGGVLDAEFGGGDGYVTTDLNTGSDGATSLALQTDGKIVVAGYFGESTGSDVAVVRYTTSGQLDGDFGHAGYVRTDLGGFDDYAVGIAIQTNGKLVVAAQYTFGFKGAGETDFALLRYLPSGGVDKEFDGDGKVLTDFGGSESATAVTLQRDGTIVVLGQNLGTGSTLLLARYEGDPTIVDQPPSIDIGGPYEVVEGGAIELSGSASDPDSTLVSYAWDLDYDGVTFTPDSNQATALFSAVGKDDGIINVAFRVMDDQGVATIVPTTVQINNVPPTISLTGNPNVDEGSAYTLTLGAVSDAGLDTVSQYIVDWGDGSLQYFVEGGQQQHQYADDGPQADKTISVSLVDEDGTYQNVASKSVTVRNVRPSDITVSNASLTGTSSNAIFAGTVHFVDPGDADTWTATIDYGDGKLEVKAAASNRAVDVNHEYTASGTYTVKITITDDEGATVTQRLNKAIVMGSKGNDTIALSLGSVIVDLNGVVTHLEEIDEVFVWGGDGDDVITMDPALTVPATLIGGLGDDWLIASGPNAKLDGGDGNDVEQTAVTAQPQVSAADGILRIWATPEADVITVTNGYLNVNGTPHSLANVSDVRIWGREGDDQINLSGLTARSYVDGGIGHDMITGGSFDDVIFGGLGDDTITGGNGHDFLVGGAGRDRIVGSAGNDILVAGDVELGLTLADLREISHAWATACGTQDESGVDLLDEAVGDTDSDQLTGSSGADLFIISSGDKITDFQFDKPKTNNDGDVVVIV